MDGWIKKASSSSRWRMNRRVHEIVSQPKEGSLVSYDTLEEKSDLKIRPSEVIIS